MSEKNTAIEKIKKLLRLGKRTNHKAEAENALMKAQKLAMKHGLKIDEINDADVTQRIVQQRGEIKRASFERQRVWRLLFDHFGVDVLFNSYRGCLYIGPEVNIAIGQHIEVFLLREASRAWDTYRAKREEEFSYLSKAGRKSLIRHEKKAFIVGFFKGIDKTLRESPLRNDRENDALKQAIYVYKQEVIKPVVKKSGPALKLNGDVWDAGEEVGATVNLSRPVEGATQRAGIAAGASRLALA